MSVTERIGDACSLRNQWLPGLGISSGIAVAAIAVARMPTLVDAAVSPLILAIVAGMAIGNLPGNRLASLPVRGFEFARGPVLRAAIVLYGLRISLSEMQAVGLDAVLVSAFMVVSTLLIAFYVGRRWFGIDAQSALLIGAGSSICGAAAVLATEGVIRSDSAKVSVAVATVVVFGSAAMFLYPLFMPMIPHVLDLAWTTESQGVYIGSTVHEVAQVLVAGSALGTDVASAALVTKMMRVCMLAPVLLFLGLAWKRSATNADGKAGRVHVPWFAVAFLALIVIHPWLGLPDNATDGIAALDDFLLATAMASLGLTVRVGTICAAGAAPLLLGLIVFGYLVFGGLLINVLLTGI